MGCEQYIAPRDENLSCCAACLCKRKSAEHDRNLNLIFVLDVNAHKKACLWILPENPKPLMFVVSSFRPAHILFSLLLGKQSRATKRSITYLREKTKNIVSGWTRGVCV